MAKNRFARKDDWVLIIGVWGIILSLLSATLVPPKAVLAVTNAIDPNGNGTISSDFSVTGGSQFETIDDGVRQPTTPNINDYISASNNKGATSFFMMSSLISVQSVNQITVWIYHNDSSNGQFFAQLYDANETTTFSSESSFPWPFTNTWSSVTFSGLSLTQTQLDNLRIRIRNSKTGGGGPTTNFLYALYADVTYSAGAQVSLTTDGSISFGAVAPGTSRDTTAGDLNDVQTISIDGDTVNIDVRSTAFSDGSNTWTLGGSAGSDQVHWEFSLDGSGWTTFAVADTLYTLDTNMPNGATGDLYLRLTAPTSTSSFNQHGATVTVVATIP